MSIGNIEIGQLLISEGVVTVEQLDAGLKEQKKTGQLICTVLIKLGFAREEKILNVLSRKLGVPYVRLKDLQVRPEVLKKVPAKFSSHYKIMPLEFKDKVLTIAMSDPLDVRTLDDIRLLLGIDVCGNLASQGEIEEAISKYYGVGAETMEKIISGETLLDNMVKDAEVTEDLEALAEDASIIKFVNQILQDAIKDRATDIHLEPFQDELRARYRIDGILYDINTPPTIKYFQAAIVSRIKIMAKLNIAERRLPQDGRIRIKINEQELDLRVSVMPTVFGESVQIRILSAGSFLELPKLGLDFADAEIIKRIILRPHGIIFVTGPTGSGKSTTLYASLAEINSARVKIITIEDPVEYQMRGVNQLQVNPQIGFTFAVALRHILRHDPNVIMVGEVRDFETAEIAIRSALTGHLVLSTLHTNDAAGAVTRLLDMGIEPFLVSSSLECLIAQRLVRLLCPKCKTQVKPNAEIVKIFKEARINPEEAKIYESKGCEDCRFIGYHGRTAIYETLPVTEPIRELILRRASAQEIKQKAIALGMRTLRQDGLRKVAEGLTTITEIIRVTQTEEVDAGI